MQYINTDISGIATCHIISDDSCLHRVGGFNLKVPHRESHKVKVPNAFIEGGGMRVEGGDGKSWSRKLVILIQLACNCVMTSLATSNQVQNYLSPTAKSVITSAVKRKLPDSMKKDSKQFDAH